MLDLPEIAGTTVRLFIIFSSDIHVVSRVYRKTLILYLPDVAGKTYWKHMLFPEESGNAIPVHVSV